VAKTHYDALGVPASADDEAIRIAFRKAVKAHHPDVNDGDKAAEQRSKLIIAAHNVLKDPEQRALYDSYLRRRHLRFRHYAITAVVSAGLVSSSTLALLYVLLKPDTRASTALSRFVTEDFRKPADPESSVAALQSSAQGLEPATHRESETGGLASVAQVALTAAGPVTVPERSAPEQAEPPAREPSFAAPLPERAWLDVERGSNALEIWAFSQRYPETAAATLALSRLERFIEGSDDIASLQALGAAANGQVAERVRQRLHRLAAATQDLTTAALPDASEARGSDPAPAAMTAHAKDMPSVEAAEAPSVDQGADVLPRTSTHSGGQPVCLGACDGSETLAAALDQPDPGNTQLDLQRAAALSAPSGEDDALADYDEAIRRDASSIAAFHGRGLLRRQRGDIERALADLDQAIRLSFSNASIYRDRGLIWYEKGRYDRAIADFNQAIKIAPDFASAYLNRGMALRRKGDFASALANFDQAIQLDPTISAAHQNRDLARMGRADLGEGEQTAPR